MMDFRLPPPDFPEPSNQSYSMHDSYNQYGSNHQYGHFPGDQIPQAPPPPHMEWSQFSQNTAENPNDQVKREALATEMQNHRAQLCQQREGFLSKIGSLKKELETLKKQKISLRGDSRRSPSPDTQRFLKENAKLQSEIEKKLENIHDVVAMLNKIIGENPKEEKSKKRKSRKKKSSSDSGDSSRESDRESRKKHKSRSKSKTGEKKYNLVFYDPELHWCTLCNVFPKTAKDYLNHLHTPQHFKAASEHIEAPWHDNQTENEGLPSYPGAASKRTPIKGLQFFTPSSAWFCKLCEKWIGDLHCASSHLKSKLHVENYAKFVESNPHWETDWISDRSKNYEKVYRDSVKESESQDAPKAEKAYSPHRIAFEDGHPVKFRKLSSIPAEENTIPLKINTKKEKKKKEKKKSKKKRRSSSVSSDSSDSSSNSEPETKNKKKEPDTNGQQKPWKEEEPPVDDSVLNQWMSVQDNPFGDQDQKILEKLKNSVKSKAGEKAEPQVDERVVSREREARELLTMRAEALKTLKKYNDKDTEEKDRYERRKRDDRDRERDRERDRDRDRDYDRDRDRDKDSRDDRRRDRRSRERDSDRRHYSSKDSDSRNSRRDNDEKHDSRSEKQSRNKESKSSSSSDPKKMPIIGKMPLFKSLNKKQDDAHKDDEKDLEKKHIDEMNRKGMSDMRGSFGGRYDMHSKLPPPGLVFPMPYGTNMDIHSMLSSLNTTSFPQTIHRVQRSPVKIRTSPVPPPPVPMSITTAIANQQSAVAAAAASKAKGKSDASLHKDFQEALDIIFPTEESKKNEEGSKEESKPTEPVEEEKMEEESTYVPEEDTTTIPMTDPNMHMMAAQGYQMVAPEGYDMSSQGYGMMMPGMMMGYDYYNQTGMYDMSQQMMTGYEDQQQDVEDPGANDEGSKMDDLAMLGIDAEDVGAGGF